MNPGKNKTVLRLLLSTIASIKLEKHLPALKPSNGRRNVTFEQEYLNMLLLAPPESLNGRVADAVRKLRQWRSDFYAFIEQHAVPAKHKNAPKRVPADIHIKMNPELVSEFQNLIVDLNAHDSVFQSGMLTDHLTQLDRFESDEHLYHIATALFTKMGRTRVKNKNVALLKKGWRTE